jgi:cytochrome P450
MSASPARTADRPGDPLGAVTHPDPYPYYADLVATRPIYRDEALRLWVAAGADAVTEVLGHSACLVRPPTEPVPGALRGSAAGTIFGRLVRMNDGARHSTLKPAVAAVSAPLATAVRGPAGRWADHLISELKPAGDPARLNEFAFSLPAYVLASPLGVAPGALAHVAVLVRDFASGIAPAATAEQLVRGGEAAGELLDTFRGLLGARGAAPASTLLGELERELAGTGVEPDDVVANGIGFLSQALEATAGLIGNTLVTLGRLMSRAPHADPDLEAFVREVARYDPPVQNTRRFVARDATIAGHAMRAGDVVLVVLAAANRDPRVNPEPSRFDPLRPSPRSFTFGSGPHACPGEAIATAIAAAGVRALLADGVEPAPLAAGVSYRPSANTRVPIF